ncbi:class I adenylate-forming enzyme family protein [Streptomyces sp. HUAS MG47]|uniref:class I adenylate-forming enzyme family protein n=1 Tax=Streptomyces solicamelliae TaxID=3231716 RepID=UPI003877F510
MAGGDEERLAYARAVARLTSDGAPFAVRDGDYAGGPATLREFVEATWGFGERLFLVGEERTYTYGEFFTAASGLARRLVDTYGLRPGDRVVIAMRNHPEWFVAFWAAQLAGLVAVPLNAWWTEDEFAYALDDCEPGLLLVDGERLPRVREWGRRRGVPGVVFHPPGDDSLPDGFVAYTPDDDPLLGPPPVDVLPEHDATIIYTSGTTGRPKGAVATHRAHVGAALNPRYHAAVSALLRGRIPGAGPTPVSLTTFPLFHVAAFTSFYPLMAAGGTLVLMRKWDAERAVDLIERHRVTHYAGVPTTALQLLDLVERRGWTDRLATLSHFNTGGAAAPPGLVGRLTALLGEHIEPRNGYGLTETCGGVLANFGAEYRAHPHSAGRPAPASEVRIEDPDPASGIGELWLRGQCLVRGYWGDEAATRAAFTPDGWFRTGDLATYADGRVTIVDRIKDMVIRGGENVYCVEVEGALYDHPDVADAAVLGVPHPTLGEEVAAAVVLKDGATTGADELRAHVGRSLAAFKVPAHVLVRNVPLPRNATGKVLKRELAALFTSSTSSTGSTSGTDSTSSTGSTSGTLFTSG